MKVAVTGATGHFGRGAIDTLLKTLAPSDIVALARDVEKAKRTLPDDLDIRPGSYEDVDQLTKSLEGVDRLLFISSRPGAPVPRQEQHQNVVTAAKNARVKFIAYTSFPHPDTAKTALADDHVATETMIIDSGIDYSFLRNNWHLENDASTIVAASHGEVFAYSSGEGHVGWALEREYAEAAAKVLLMDHPKKVYEFAGMPATFEDLATAVAEVSGTEAQVRTLSDDDYQATLEDAGLDSELAKVLTSFQTLIRNGDLSEDTSDLADVLGRPVTTLEDGVREILDRQ